MLQLPRYKERNDGRIDLTLPWTSPFAQAAGSKAIPDDELVGEDMVQLPLFSASRLPNYLHALPGKKSGGVFESILMGGLNFCVTCVCITNALFFFLSSNINPTLAFHVILDFFLDRGAATPSWGEDGGKKPPPCAGFSSYVIV